MIDPTTVAIEAQVEERDRLRAENRRLHGDIATLHASLEEALRRWEGHDYDRGACAYPGEAECIAELRKCARAIQEIWLKEKS